MRPLIESFRAWRTEGSPRGRRPAAYLAAERDLGRVAAGADVDTLALTLIGAGHLLFAGRDGTRRRRPTSTGW